MEDLITTHFWIAVSQIILIDIVLGGDNAVVIALACRDLPEKQRFQGILWGTAGAILLRVLLIVFAMSLLKLPFLKLVGALLLLWIGIKLIVPHADTHQDIHASTRLWGAIKTIIIADLVMSLDNVIGIAAAAQNAGEKHEILLVTIGLLISIPIIVWGSTIVLKLMQRWPIIVTLGGMLLGWIAGSMAQSDPIVHAYIPQNTLWHVGLGLCGALFVLAAGQWIKHRQKRMHNINHG